MPSQSKCYKHEEDAGISAVFLLASSHDVTSVFGVMETTVTLLLLTVLRTVKVSPLLFSLKVPMTAKRTLLWKRTEEEERSAGYAKI